MDRPATTWMHRDLITVKVLTKMRHPQHVVTVGQACPTVDEGPGQTRATEPTRPDLRSNRQASELVSNQRYRFIAHKPDVPTDDCVGHRLIALRQIKLGVEVSRMLLVVQ